MEPDNQRFNVNNNIPNPNFNYYEPPKSSFTSNLVEFIQTLVVFAAIGTVVYLFVAQPHKVSGPSMYPTFNDGDYIISDKVSYLFGAPKRGDVIVFKSPQDHTVDFIKRVIALPGDKVKVQNNHVYVNGQLSQEKYLQEDVQTEGMSFLTEGRESTVPDNSYVVFGDNRTRSSDSRSWGFVTKDEIIGKVFLRYWPPSALGFSPGASK